MASVDVEQEVAFASDPDRWPRWPQLPLVKRTSGELGRLLNQSLASDVVEPVVYLGSIYQPPDEEQVVRYASLGELFMDGWRID